jgi:cell division protein ZipA
MSETAIRMVLLAVGAVIILGILWDGLRRKHDRVETPQTARKKMNEPLFSDEVMQIKKEVLELMQPTSEASHFSPPLSGLEFSADQTDEVMVSEEAPAVDLTLPPLSSNDYPALVKTELDEREGVLQDLFISIRVQAQPPEQFGGYRLLQVLLGNRLDYGDLHLFHRYADVRKTKKLFSVASDVEPGDFDLNKMNNMFCNGLILYMNAAQHEDPVNVFEDMLETAQTITQDLGGLLMSGEQKLWTEEATAKILNALNAMR